MVKFLGDAMPIAIYHNPHCSKSREALRLLYESGKALHIIEYLKTPPTIKELTIICKKLALNPWDIVRRKEALFEQLQFSLEGASKAQWLTMLVDNPSLIERPIVINGNKGIVARPPDKIWEIL